MMKAGALDRRVTVQIRTRMQSATSGEEAEGWADLFTVWMSKRDLRTSERFAAEQIVAEVDSSFRARWSAALLDIRPDTHRLVHRGRLFEIHGVADLGRLEGVEFACAARGEAHYGEDRP